MFGTAFERDPMDKEEGRRYRYGVLEKGGAQDEMKTVSDFLGREPKTEAFYKQLGLAWYQSGFPDTRVYRISSIDIWSLGHQKSNQRSLVN